MMIFTYILAFVVGFAFAGTMQDLCMQWHLDSDDAGPAIFAECLDPDSVDTGTPNLRCSQLPLKTCYGIDSNNTLQPLDNAITDVSQLRGLDTCQNFTIGVPIGYDDNLGSLRMNVTCDNNDNNWATSSVWLNATITTDHALLNCFGTDGDYRSCWGEQ
ncbi:hypothetical protein PG989_012395 [Apiospora arundinis]